MLPAPGLLWLSGVYWCQSQQEAESQCQERLGAH